MATVAQMRAARALLGWSQTGLAEAAGISRATIARAELSADTSADAVAAIQRALEKAGVIFQDENGEGPGVRLKKGKKR